MATVAFDYLIQGPASPSCHLEVSNRVGRIEDTHGNVPVLHQTCANHPPNVGNGTHTLYGGNTLEVRDGEVGARGIGADENVVNFDGASRQHRLQSLDSQCDTVAGNPAV